MKESEEREVTPWEERVSARGDDRHAHAARGVHLAPLTPLTRTAHARSCTMRALAQRRLRGAQQACGAYST